MLTTRDFEVVEFVRQFKIADTDTIAALFFPSRDACYKRLRQLVVANHLARYRDSMNNQYLYYVKPPKQLRHSLLVSRFYGSLASMSSVAKFSIEPRCGQIRPDAAFIYDSGHGPQVGLLEVEISNKGFDWGKYERFFASNDYLQYMTALPAVYVVSDKPVQGNVIQINTSLKNMRVD